MKTRETEAERIEKLEEQLRRSNNCILRVPGRKNKENKREEIMFFF